MKKEYWFVLWITIVIIAIAYIVPSNDHWSMVYEAIQVPELVCDDDGNCVPADQKRFVLFNEDGLSRQECTDLFDEHLRRLNNNAAVIEYEIGCGHLQTKGHGTEFQRQMHWMIP
jgi:hypothetical protein